MNRTEQELREILQQDVEVSDIVNKKLQETYKHLEAKQNAKSEPEKKRRWRYRVPAILAAAIITCAGSTAVFAAATGGSFDNLFGNATKQNLPVQTVTQKKGEYSVEVTVPSKEFAALDEDLAQSLLGDYSLKNPIVQKIGDHTMTIQNFVYDKYGAVMSFTLEREGGVTMLEYDKVSNQGKGARFSNDSRYYFGVSHGKPTDAVGSPDHIYVDQQQSTKERLVCTAYILFSPEDTEEAPTLNITKMDMSNAEFNDMVHSNQTNFGRVEEDKTSGRTEPKPEEIPDDSGVPKQIQTHTFVALPSKMVTTQKTAVSATGGSVEVSPFTMRLKLDNAIADGERRGDPWCVQSVKILFNDNTEYVVQDREALADNTGYAMGSYKGDDKYYNVTFNRLVDINQIREVQVNGISYPIS